MDVPEFFLFFFPPEFIGFHVFHRNRFLLSIIPQPSSNSRNVVPSLVLVSIYSFCFSLPLSFSLFVRSRKRKREKRERRKIRTRLNDSIGERSGRQEATGLLLSLLTKWSNERSRMVIWTLSGFNWTRNDFRTSSFSPRRENDNYHHPPPPLVAASPLI